MTNNSQPPTTKQMETTLAYLLEYIADFDELLQDIEAEDLLSEISICTFQDAGILTYDRGLVLDIHTNPPAQFQITIVDSSHRVR